MKYVDWMDEKWTTIDAVANYYTEGNKELSKEIKPFIRTGVKKLDTIKLEKKEVEQNIDILQLILRGSIAPNGLLLIKLSDVPSLEHYFKFVLKQKKEDTYKKDRYYSKRDLLEEFRLELERNAYRINSNEFKAILSYVSRLEQGQPKVKTLRSASKKFKVTQVRIKKIVDSLNIQIDFKNKPRGFI